MSYTDAEESTIANGMRSAAEVYKKFAADLRTDNGTETEMPKEERERLAVQFDRQATDARVLADKVETHGIQQGEEILRRVAAAIRQTRAKMVGFAESRGTMECITEIARRLKQTSDDDPTPVPDFNASQFINDCVGVNEPFERKEQS